MAECCDQVQPAARRGGEHWVQAHGGHHRARRHVSGDVELHHGAQRGAELVLEADVAVVVDVLLAERRDFSYISA